MLQSRSHVSGLQLAVALGSIGAAAVVLAFASGDALTVILPLVCSGLLFVGFSTITRRRNPPSYLGLAYGAAILLYCALPLIRYLYKGMQYEESWDARLLTLNPNPDEVAAVAWHCVVYSLAFSLVYSIRSTTQSAPHFMELKNRPSLLVVAGLLVVLTIFFWVLQLAYPLTTGAYGESYLVAMSMPLLLGQISNHLSGIFVITNLMVLILLFTNYRRYRGWIFFLLVYHVITILTTPMGRASVVQYFVAAFLLYERFVKPVRLPILLAGAVIGLFGFLAYGILRDTIPRGQEIEVTAEVLRSANEFDSIFANALEFHRYRETGLLHGLPTELYFSDLLSLIPRQLLSFEKTTWTIWYLDTFHPETRTAGGGLAFGVLPESSAGFGLIELAIRGAVIGLCFALVHRWYSRNRESFGRTLIYLWFCVSCYQSFRATSFVFLSTFLFQVVPTLLFVRAIGFRSSAKRSLQSASGSLK